ALDHATMNEGEPIIRQIYSIESPYTVISVRSILQRLLGFVFEYQSVNYSLLLVLDLVNFLRFEMTIHVLVLCRFLRASSIFYAIKILFQWHKNNAGPLLSPENPLWFAQYSTHIALRTTAFEAVSIEDGKISALDSLAIVDIGAAFPDNAVAYFPRIG